jgi:hypothetical protein
MKRVVVKAWPAISADHRMGYIQCFVPYLDPFSQVSVGILIHTSFTDSDRQLGGELVLIPNKLGTSSKKDDVRHAGRCKPVRVAWTMMQKLKILSLLSESLIKGHLCRPKLDHPPVFWARFFDAFRDCVLHVDNTEGGDFETVDTRLTEAIRCPSA